MKKLLFLLLPVFCNAQNIGYKPQNKFDTVKCIILIMGDENRALHSYDLFDWKRVYYQYTSPVEIRGYVVRQWNVWYGGIDSYINPGYSSLPDRFIPIDKFLITNKEDTIPLDRIWLHVEKNW